MNSITVSGKLEELFDCAQHHKAQIIGITESWLGQGINATLPLLEGYQSPDRRDHNRHDMGGITVYVHETIIYNRRPDLEITNYEIIWINCHIGTHNLFNGTVYLSFSDTSVEMIDGFYDMLSNVYTDNKQQEPTSVVIIQGDLNPPCHAWYPESTTQTSRAGIKLLQFTNFSGLSQLVNVATFLSDQTKSQLDVAITDAPDCCISCYTLPQICDCHHLPVLMALSFKISHDSPYNRRIHDYDNADWVGLNNALKNLNFQQCYISDFPENIVVS